MARLFMENPMSSKQRRAKIEKPPMTKEENEEWNVHKNIAGWSLIAFCASRFFTRLPKWGASPRLAAFIEVVLVVGVFVTVLWAVAARNKKRWQFVPWMTQSQRAFNAGTVVSGLYALVLLIELWIG
jgi:hypothetical protein